MIEAMVVIVHSTHLALLLACCTLLCGTGSKVALDAGVPAATPAVIAQLTDGAAGATIACGQQYIAVAVDYVMCAIPQMQHRLGSVALLLPSVLFWLFCGLGGANTLKAAV
jgi:hypothetical protein